MKKNKLLLISGVLSILYLLYIIYYISTFKPATAMDQAAAGLATVIMMPHIIVVAIATIFNWLGYGLNKRGFALTGAILYTISIVLMPIYIPFVIVQTILSYIGYAKIKKEV